MVNRVGSNQITVEVWDRNTRSLKEEKWELDEVTNISYHALARVSVVDGNLLQSIDIYVDFLEDLISPEQRES